MATLPSDDVTVDSQPQDSYVACLHCDLLIHGQSLSHGQRAVCPRCQQVLYYEQRNITTSLALLVTALVLYLPAVLLPFLSMQAAGQVHQVSLWGSLAEITQGSSIYLAITVFMLVMFLPLVKFVGVLFILLSLKAERLPVLNVTIVRYILKLASWSMVEVYLIGVIVTLVKLSSIADIAFLSGFYVFLFLMLIDALISLTLPRKRIWQNIGLASSGESSYPHVDDGK